MSNKLPTLKNTWELSVNVRAGRGVSTLDSYQKSMWQIKETLIGFSSNPWTVVSSSDGVNYTGNDGYFLGLMADESGNGNEGVHFGMSSSDITSDVPGGDFSTLSSTFNASTKYIVCGDGTGVVDFEHTDSFSISCWFKSTANSDYMVSKESSARRGYGVLTDTSGRVVFKLSNTFTVALEVQTNTTGFNDGEWHHTVCTYNGSGAASGMSIYVDGQIEALTTNRDNLAGNTIQTTQPVNISGFGNGAGGEWDGSIDDVAIYNKELTLSEVSTIYSAGASRFSFNSMNFDGTNDFVSIGDVTALKFDVGDAFSISAWFRTTSVGTQRSLVSKRETGAAAAGYDLAIATTNQIFIQIIDDATVPQRAGIRVNATHNDGLWHHVVMTKDTTENASGLTLYIDGTEAAITVFDDTFVSGGGTSFDNTAPFQMSGFSGANSNWLGDIDDVAVYNKELSSTEVATIYNGGDPNNLTSSGPTANLVGYWRMGDSASFPTIPDDSTNSNDGTATNMDSGDITGHVPISFTGPIDLSAISSPSPANLVGYWLMGEDVVKSTNDFPDLWVDSSRLVWATQPAAHSWIIIQHPIRNTQLCLNCNRSSVSGRLASMFVSFGGKFVGGDTTEKPAAVDELPVGDGTIGEQWLGPILSAFNSWVHGWQSDDGLKTRVMVGTSAGTGQGTFLLFDEIDTSAPNWEQKEIALIAMHKSTSGGSVFETGSWMSVAKNQFSSSNHPNKFLIGKLLLLGGPLKDTSVSHFSEGSTVFNAITSPTSAEDEHVLVGDVAELKFDSTDPFSTSGWFRTTEETLTQIMMSKRDQGGTNRGYDVQFPSAGGITFQLINDSGTGNRLSKSTNANFNDGMWHHLVTTYDGSESASGVNIYVDGALITDVTVAFDALSGTIDTTTGFQISGNAGSNTGFIGNIDDVAVYSRELSASEVTDIYNGGEPNDLRLGQPALDGYLAGYWFMGDGDVFPTVTDRSASGNDGTCTNMEREDLGYGDTPGNPMLYFRVGSMQATSATGTSWILHSSTFAGVPNELDSKFPIITDLSDSSNDGTATNMDGSDIQADTPGGASSYSLSFDGINDYIVVGDVVELQFERTDVFTLSCWFKTSGAPSGFETLIAKLDSSAPNPGYEMFFNQTTGSVGFQLINTVTTNQLRVETTTTGFNDGAWHHAVATWDGDFAGGVSGVHIYVDNVDRTLSTIANNLTGSIATTTPFQIAAHDGANLPFQGFIDDVGVYDKELTSGEVNTIHGSGAPVDLTVTGPDGYLVGYWTMGDAEGAPAFPIFPIALYSDYGFEGHYGFLDDLWWGSAGPSGVAPGSTFPNDPNNRQLAQSGDIVHVWTNDDTLPLFGGSGATNPTHDVHFIDTSDVVGGGKVKYFQMEGIDTGNPSQPAYHNWVVVDAPDPNGDQAVGPDAPPFGGPLTNIVVSNQWVE